MQGIVQSGGTASLHIVAEQDVGRTIEPVANATVTLYESAGGGPSVVGQATTGADGSFSIGTTTTESSGIFYATADLGGGVMLMAILGPKLLDSITINELTTVAACYSAAQFLAGAGIQGDVLPLRIVAGMSANIANVVDGTSSPVLENSPNANQTNALGVTRSLANLLASCVRGPALFLKPFFDLATPPGGATPADTIAAMGNIARSPANHAGGIFIQSKAVMCYQPPVGQQPDAWTIVVKVNDSGDDAHMFGGPGNLAFDSRGRAWILNNVVQGTPGSTEWSIVLDAAGHPALDDDGRKMSPFTGGGLLGPGYGIAIDSQDRVWIGDFGWTKDTQPMGSVSLFDSNANALSPSPHGFTAGVKSVQGMAFDGDGNLWMASYRNGAVVLYPGAGRDTKNPGRYHSYPETPDSNFQPFGVAIASDGTAWVTDSNAQSSGILHLRFHGDRIEKLYELRIGKVMKGIVIDSEGCLWAASGGDDTVYRFDAGGNLLGFYQGGGIYGPWGICLDGADNVWVANFGPLETGSVVHGRVTQLAGVNAAGHLAGTGLTPQTGYTLPSAGDPVLLHDGTPLYGLDGPPCYIPMMRTTGVNVDAAGNVWTCNNWKPDFDIDIGDPATGKPGNPGGDGMLIWVGVAKPVTH